MPPDKIERDLVKEIDQVKTARRCSVSKLTSVAQISFFNNHVI